MLIYVRRSQLSTSTSELINFILSTTANTSPPSSSFRKPRQEEAASRKRRRSRRRTSAGTAAPLCFNDARLCPAYLRGGCVSWSQSRNLKQLLVIPVINLYALEKKRKKKKTHNGNNSCARWKVVAGAGNTKWDEAKLMVPGRETICQG